MNNESIVQWVDMVIYEWKTTSVQLVYTIDMSSLNDKPLRGVSMCDAFSKRDRNYYIRYVVCVTYTKGSKSRAIAYSNAHIYMYIAWLYSNDTSFY